MWAVAVSPEYRAFWTITIASLCGVSCAILGCFLVLRRLSLLGDAISHGILPGIALAVLLTGSLAAPLLLVGAMIFGFLTAFLAQSLQSWGKVSEDASLGVVFTSLFALGVILITRFLHDSHLDTECIFFGLLDAVTLRRPAVWFGVEVPDVFGLQLATFVLTLVFVLLFWKELKLATFDPELAAAMGFRPTLMHYLLIALVAGSTVAAFDAVGSILVLAMLVVPAATAHLLTDRLTLMLIWAAALAVLAAILAYILASPSVFASNTPGMMAVVSGGLFVLALILAPRHGLMVQAVRRFRLGLRIAGDEILASLYRSEEGTHTTLAGDLREHGIAAWMTALARWLLFRQGLISRSADGLIELTSLGRERARQVVQSHRLWESFLDAEFALPADHLHAPASRLEHFIGPQLRGELANQLHQPAVDPHGRAIPAPVDVDPEKPPPS